MRRVLLVGTMVLATLLGPSATLAGTAAVTVFYAGGAGLAGPGQTLLQDNPEAGDLSGSALASGSFRHNGRFDLVVGAPGEGISLQFGMGAVAVYLGEPGGITPGSPRIVTQREAGGMQETGDQFGSALAAGLYNNDDFYDLAIGVPGEDIGTVVDAGAVSTMHGSAGGLAGTGSPLFQGDDGLGDVPERGDRFGQTLAKGIFSNNFNEDPFDDLAVGVALDDVGDRPDAAWSASSRARRLAFRAWTRSTSRVPTSAGARGSAASPRPATCWEPPSSDGVPHPSGSGVGTSQDKASRPAQSPRRSLVAGPRRS